MKTLCFLVFCYLMFLINTCIDNPEMLVYKEIKGDTIFFNNGKFFKTGLFDLNYLGQLNTKNKLPYLVLSGRQCDECDENTSIYIHSFSDGLLKQQNRYMYPGKLLDYMSNKCIFESKLFIGDCYSKNSLVWRQLYYDESEKVIADSLFIVKVVADSIIETTIQTSLKIKPNNNCQEINGILQSTEP